MPAHRDCLFPRVALQRRGHFSAVQIDDAHQASLRIARGAHQDRQLTAERARAPGNVAEARCPRGHPLAKANRPERPTGGEVEDGDQPVPVQRVQEPAARRGPQAGMIGGRGRQPPQLLFPEIPFFHEPVGLLEQQEGTVGLKTAGHLPAPAPQAGRHGVIGQAADRDVALRVAESLPFAQVVPGAQVAAGLGQIKSALAPLLPLFFRANVGQGQGPDRQVAHLVESAGRLGQPAPQLGRPGHGSQRPETLPRQAAEAPDSHRPGAPPAPFPRPAAGPARPARPAGWRTSRRKQHVHEVQRAPGRENPRGIRRHRRLRHDASDPTAARRGPGPPRRCWAPSWPSSFGPSGGGARVE